MSRNDELPQSHGWLTGVFLYLWVFAAWLGATVVPQICVARSGHDYGAFFLRLAGGIALAAGLTPVVILRLTVILENRHQLSRDKIQAKIRLCHLPLFFSWLGILDVPLPFFGNLQALVAIGIFSLTAVSFLVVFFDPAATTATTACYALRSFFSEHRTGRRLARYGPPIVVLFLCLVLMAVYAGTYGQVSFDDGCEFGGDVWEYQSIAVNYARGHGFPIFGGIEPFDVYSFGHEQDRRFPDLVKRFYAEATPNRPVFYRAPGYTFFLGTIYKHCGISPRIAKDVQLWLLITVASFLPVIGWMCWKWSGLVGASFAGWLFLHIYHKMAGLLITENLLTFLAFLFVLVFLIWEKRTNFVSSAAIGAVLAGCLLTKGWFYPLVPMVFIFGLLRIRKKLMQWWHLVAVFGVMLLVILPWSVYATVSSGRLTFICTQGAIDMPNVNNEKVIETGKWEPEAAKAPGSFYQRPDVKSLPWPFQVFLFHVEYAKSIPLMWLRKFRRSYSNFPFFRLAFVFVCLEVARNVVNGLYQRTVPERRTEFLRVLTSVLLWIIGFEIVLGVFFGINLFAWLRADVNYLLVFAVPFVLLKVAVRDVPNVTGLHPAILIIVLNSVAITLLYYGYDRFIWPVDAFLMLITMRYAVAYLWKIPLTVVRLHARAAGA